MSHLEASYILHTRPYRDTSLLIDLFTQNFGVLRVIGRGLRSKRSRQRELAQPFIPLLVDWRGSGALPLLTNIESASLGSRLLGRRLYCGLYINELMLRLLAPNDPAPVIFEDYAKAITELASQDEEIVLRQFEFNLLSNLGYANNFGENAQGEPIQSHKAYAYHLEQGFIECHSDQASSNIFSGVDLLAIAANNYEKSATKSAAKRLTRYLFMPLLGTKPLKSREFFYEAHK